MVDDFEALDVFLSLTQTGSVQATADELGMTAPNVSRKLAKLERNIGRKLFDRSKRPLTMTRDARNILDAALRIREERARITNYCRSLQDEDTILIRMMIGNSQMRFAPDFIAEYAQMYPTIRFNMISPPDVEEFKAGKADLINLSGQAALTDCVELPRGKMIFVPVASPSYLERHGPVEHPSELAHHRVFSTLYPHRFDFVVRYPLVKNGLTMTFSAIETIRFSNVIMTHQAVLNGAGIAPCMPLALCIDDLEAGRLVPILNGWHRPAHTSVLACKKEDWKIRHIRLFATWWAQKLSAHERSCEKRLVDLFGRSFLTNLTH